MPLPMLEEVLAPPLRADLVMEAEGEKTKVTDPVTKRVYRFDPHERKLLSLLDGRRPLSEVVHAFQGDEAVERPGEWVPSMLRFLEAIQLVDEEWVQSDIAEYRRYAEIRAGASAGEVPVHFLRDSYWTCLGCGHCCGEYTLGPIEHGTVERLQQSDIRDRLPHLKPYADLPLFYTEKGQDGKDVWYLTKVDGHCIFQTPDNLCGVHSALGYKAKPHICQLFPHLPRNTVRGVVIAKQLECQNHWQTFDRPVDVEGQLEGIRDIIQLVAGGPVIDGPMALFENLVISFEVYQLLEDVLLEIAAGEGHTVGEKLAMGRDFLLQAANRVRATSRGVYPVVRRLCAERRGRTYPRPYRGESVDRQCYFRAVEALCDRIVEMSEEILSGEDEASERRHYWDLLNTLHMVRGRARLVSGEERMAPADFYRAVEAVEYPDERRDFVAFYRFYLRETIYSKDLIRLKSVAAAYGHLCFTILVHRWQAKMKAAIDGARSVDPKRMNEAFTSVHRVLRRSFCLELFEQSTAELETLFRHFTFEGESI